MHLTPKYFYIFKLLNDFSHIAFIQIFEFNIIYWFEFLFKFSFCDQSFITIQAIVKTSKHFSEKEFDSRHF